MTIKHIQKLDSVRGFAALYVLFYHWIEDFAFIPKTFKLVFFSFGQEAVMLFFLLSGFVIYLSSHRKKTLKFRDYFIKRFRRIYFPFLVAIIISVLIFLLNGQLVEKFSWSQLLGNFLMLQDISFLKPGTWFDPFLRNVALWSLTYEWWFYMLFFLIYSTIFKNKNRIYIILGLSLFSYLFYLIAPNPIALILSYFIIWWSGVEAADIFVRNRSFTFSKAKPILFCLISMCILTFIPVLYVENIEFGFYPFLIFRHFFVSLFIVITALIWYKYKMILFDKIFGAFTSIAPISYGIYIFHYPILLQWNLNLYIDNIWIVAFLKLVILLSLSYLVEIQLQPVVNRYLK